MRTWWPNDGSEPYWIEITDRSDQGEELSNYLQQSNGRDNPSSLLLQEMSVGDRVLHYDKNTRAVIGVSSVSGRKARKVDWAGYPALSRAIEGFRRFEQPIGIDAFRRRSSELRRIHRDLKRRHSEPLRFPFQWSGRDLRLAQVYIAKLPDIAVQAVPELVTALENRQPPGRIGRRMRPVDTNVSTEATDPFGRDPDEVDRGLRGHRATQERLRKALIEAVASPLNQGWTNKTRISTWPGTSARHCGLRRSRASRRRIPRSS